MSVSVTKPAPPGRLWKRRFCVVYFVRLSTLSREDPWIKSLWRVDDGSWKAGVAGAIICQQEKGNHEVAAL